MEIVKDVNLNKPFNHKSNAPLKKNCDCVRSAYTVTQGARWRGRVTAGGRAKLTLWEVVPGERLGSCGGGRLRAGLRRKAHASPERTVHRRQRRRRRQRQLPALCRGGGSTYGPAGAAGPPYRTCRHSAYTVTVQPPSEYIPSACKVGPGPSSFRIVPPCGETTLE